MITRQLNIMLDTMNLTTLQSNIAVTQNDKDVNTLIIKILHGGTEIDYDVVDHAKILFEKSDKTVIAEDLDRASNSFVYRLGTEEISLPGRVLVIVHLYGEQNERIATAKFSFTVERDLG